MSKRTVKPPTPADSEYALVQFIQDGEYSIIPSHKILQNQDGECRAPYGPHDELYQCIIQRKSENKDTLLKIFCSIDDLCKKKDVDKGVNKKKRNSEETQITSNKKKKSSETEEIIAAEKEKKKEEKEEKKKEQLKKKEEQQRKREARELQKKTALEQNSKLLMEMQDFRNSIAADYNEDRADDLAASIEDDASSFPGINITDTADNFLNTSVGTAVTSVPCSASPLSALIKRPTVGKKCPRQQFLPTVVCPNCQEKDRKISSLEQQLAALKGNEGERLGSQSKDSKGTPRAGKLPKEVASLHQMIELVPGSGVSMYQSQLDEAQRKKTGTAAARHLLSCCYTASELMEAGNLTGKHNKKGLDCTVVEAIVAYACKKDNSCTASSIRVALRCKIAGLLSSHKT